MEKKRKVDVLDLPMWLIPCIYLFGLMVLLVGYGVCWFFARSWMVLDLEDLFKEGPISTAMSKVWFIFAWGFGVTFLVGFTMAIKRKPRDREPSETFVKGIWLSVNAGFFEELMFRWLTFFTAMVTLRAFNAITFGLLEKLYTGLLMPLANWATFGALEQQLINHPQWILGAAIISANASFRDGHKYLGPFGFINSWFIGMIMHYLVFNYGLVAAICAHAAYDICVFTAAAITSAMRPKQFHSNLNIDALLPWLRRQRRVRPYGKTNREVEFEWERRMRGNT